MPYPIKRVALAIIVFDIYEEVYDLLRIVFSSPKTLTSKKASRFWIWARAGDCLEFWLQKKLNSVVAVDLNPFAIRCAKGKCSAQWCTW